MKAIKWQRFLWHISCWMIAEIVLTGLGIDDLADYGEFQSGKSYLLPYQAIERLI